MCYINIYLYMHKVGVGLMLVALSLAFVFLPNNLAFPYFGLFSLYFPSSMLQNTVSLSDSQDTVNALYWVKDNMPDDACLLVHRVFYGWASLTMDGDKLIHYGYDAPETAAQELEENGAEYQLYLIWWVNGSGWHGQANVSSAFGQVYNSNRIAIFTYNNDSYSSVSYIENQ